MLQRDEMYSSCKHSSKDFGSGYAAGAWGGGGGSVTKAPLNGPMFSESFTVYHALFYFGCFTSDREQG